MMRYMKFFKDLSEGDTEIQLEQSKQVRQLKQDFSNYVAVGDLKQEISTKVANKLPIKDVALNILKVIDETNWLSLKINESDKDGAWIARYMKASGQFDRAINPKKYDGQSLFLRSTVNPGENELSFNLEYQLYFLNNLNEYIDKCFSKYKEGPAMAEVYKENFTDDFFKFVSNREYIIDKYENPSKYESELVRYGL